MIVTTGLTLSDEFVHKSAQEPLTNQATSFCYYTTLLDGDQKIDAFLKRFGENLTTSFFSASTWYVRLLWRHIIGLKTSSWRCHHRLFMIQPSAHPIYSLPSLGVNSASSQINRSGWTDETPMKSQDSPIVCLGQFRRGRQRVPNDVNVWQRWWWCHRFFLLLIIAICTIHTVIAYYCMVYLRIYVAYHLK